MTPNEWLDYYQLKTGCTDLELSPDEQVLFHPQSGFISFFIHDDILELHHLCGDGQAWKQILHQIMKERRLKKLRAFTRRNPKAWMRKYGGHIRGYYMEADIDELRSDDDGKRR